ncbi:MAG: TetR/AcrR family transcriptional regulator [Deltaproteobacteria bacterium]|nr:MAG: TetR/AcrR family transcriptional regulator [Deltaproteobacteria bacterium]
MIRTSTSPVGRRQRNRERKLALFLDHALAIVISDGLDALTMPGLAEAADTGVGSLYRYFSGKDAVIAALQVHAVGAFAEHLSEAVGERRGLEALRAITRSWAGFRDARPELFALADQSLSDPRQLLDDEQEAEVAATLAPALRRVHLALTEAVDDGDLAPGDATLRTHALWAAIHGAEHFRKRERRSGVGADALRDELVTAILAGWGRR